MTNSQFENIKSDLLPYDFVKDNEVIVSESNNEFIAISPFQLSLDLFWNIIIVVRWRKWTGKYFIEYFCAT